MAMHKGFTNSERVVLSLYGGMMLPLLYLAAITMIIGLFGSRLSDRVEGWLVSPLAWPALTFERFYHPRIEAVGDVFGAAAEELTLTVVVDYLTFALAVFVLFMTLNWMKKSRSIA